MQPIDTNPGQPLGKVGLIIFLMGTLFSDLVEFGPITQVILNIVLILVGILTGIHYIIKIIKELKPIKDDAVK